MLISTMTIRNFHYIYRAYMNLVGYMDQYQDTYLAWSAFFL